MTDNRRYPEDGDTVDGTTERPPPPDDALRFDDPHAVRQWLTLVREQVDLGFGAAEDATRPIQERVLSRHEARRRIQHAEQVIRTLIETAERGLPLSLARRSS